MWKFSWDSPEFSLQFRGASRGSIVIDIPLNSNKSYNTYKLQSIYYYAYLNRSLMHPHGVHSYAHPMDCVDNSQWNFHFPDTEHRPAKSFHFLDQTVHCLEHWQQKDTQVDDRQLEQHFHPNYRHKQFPRYRCNRSPLCPLQANVLQSVLVYKLDTINSYFGLETNINLFDYASISFRAYAFVKSARIWASLGLK